MVGMSPELIESITLSVAAGWMLYLYHHRRAGRALLFAALYLAFPAVGLGIQAAGLWSMVETAKWFVVTTNVAITVAMIVTTRNETSPLIRALANVEAARVLEAMQLRAKAAEAAAHRAELRGAVYCLVALRQSTTEPLQPPGSGTASASASGG